MELQDILEHAKELFSRIPRALYLPLAILVVGMIVFSIGLIQLFLPQNTPPVSGNSNENNLPTPVKATTIAVDVEGAVMQPGVYQLKSTDRVKDALIAAGGLSESADRDYVAKQINLAAKMVDGFKLYVPQAGSRGEAGALQEISAASTLNVNLATLSDLDALPGVGPVTAQKIIDARPYSSIDELLSKKVVTNSVFQKIKDKISVY